MRAILHRAQREGQSVVGFKPMSSHNYWDHFDHSRTCEALGGLVSRDALSFHEVLADPPEVELLNPYHQVVCPLDWMNAREVGDHYLDEERPGILAERLSSPEGGTTLFLNERPEIFVAPGSFVEAVRQRADRTVAFRTSPVAEGLAAVEEAVQASFRALTARWESVVIESFSDVAVPLSLQEEDLDLVVSVGGSLVVLTEPAEFGRVQEIVRGQRMIRFLKYLKPVGVFRAPLLGTPEREDLERLERGYAEVLDGLWDVLG